jgi:hypothetical protein
MPVTGNSENKTVLEQCTYWKIVLHVDAEPCGLKRRVLCRLY